MMSALPQHKVSSENAVEKDGGSLNLGIILIGYSHKNAPVDFRDKISLGHDPALAFIDAAMSHDSLIKEIAIVSTCNRTEFYFVSSSPEHLRQWLIKHYESIRNVDISQDSPEPLMLFNEDAVDHLLSVAGGLESMLLGENQILSQVKSSYDLILSSGHQFPILNRLFQEAIRTGKAIRTCTALCQGAASISLAAVDLARKIFSTFENRRILLIGAGETSELVATHFHRMGANQFVIANRGKKRREHLVARFGGHAISLEEIPSALVQVDIAVAAVKAESLSITYHDMVKAMKARHHRALLLVDISTPRVIDPRIADVSSAFLYNIDHLKNVVANNINKRRKEIPAAKAIVSEIREDYLTWLRTLEVVPTISRLSNYFDAIRTQELKKFVHRTSEKEYHHMEKLSESMVRKLLHYPITSLREMSNGSKIDPVKIDVIWELFRLHEFDGERK